MLPVDAKPIIVFGAGYMANDALDRIGSITNKAMTRTVVVNEKGETVKVREMDETIFNYKPEGENEALDRPPEPK